jgi:hypothetical protein
VSKATNFRVYINTGGTHRTKTYTDFWFETLEETERFGDPGADRITILNGILKKQEEKV